MRNLKINLLKKKRHPKKLKKKSQLRKKRMKNLHNQSSLQLYMPMILSNKTRFKQTLKNYLLPKKQKTFIIKLKDRKCF